MRKLISNSTNIPLTKNEVTVVVVKAVAASLLGLGLTAVSIRNMAKA